MIRSDGRNNVQIRDLQYELDIVTRANGSARFSHGNTSFIAGIYGPAQPKSSRREDINKCTVDVLYRPLVGMSTYIQRSREYYLQRAIESILDVKKIPKRTIISIVIQEINCDGSLLSVAFNTIIIALLHAGIPLQTLPIAITTCIYKKENDQYIYLDPIEEELIRSNNNNNNNSHTNNDENNDKYCINSTNFILDSSNDIVSMKSNGNLTESLLNECLHLSIEHTIEIKSFILNIFANKN